MTRQAPPSPLAMLQDRLRALGRFIVWLFPPPDRSKGLVRGLADWFLPSLHPTAPAPSRDYHGPEGEPRLYRLANAYPLPTWRPLARAVMTLFGIFLIWALLAQLDEVAIAEGEVVPEGKVRIIQHLEGGTVREIMTAEGDVVKEGQPLMLVDLPASSLNRDELQVRLDGYVLQRARLLAEMSGGDPAFPEAESKRQPALLLAERHQLDTRRQSLKAGLAVIQDQIHAKSLEVQEYETKLRSLGTNLRLSEERFAISKDLMKSGLASRMDHVQLQGQVEELRGQMDSVRASVPRAQANLQEAKSRLEEEQAKFQRTAQGEMTEAELNLARTRELLNQASDQQRRTSVTSPIDGIVKNLKANTIGGVIRPGDPIMEIVPLHERLQIDARLSPMDRGYVQTGQRATVKISAYDYTTYGGLEGDVILVAADTTVPQQQTQNAQPYYRVVVQTETAFIGDKADKRAISPGMQATVEIHTGTRSVMEFLIKPVLKLRHEAFRER